MKEKQKLEKALTNYERKQWYQNGPPDEIATRRFIQHEFENETYKTVSDKVDALLQAPCKQIVVKKLASEAFKHSSGAMKIILNHLHEDFDSATLHEAGVYQSVKATLQQNQSNLPDSVNPDHLQAAYRLVFENVYSINELHNVLGHTRTKYQAALGALPDLKQKIDLKTCTAPFFFQWDMVDRVRVSDIADALDSWADQDVVDHLTIYLDDLNAANTVYQRYGEEIGVARLKAKIDMIHQKAILQRMKNFDRPAASIVLDLLIKLERNPAIIADSSIDLGRVKRNIDLKEAASDVLDHYQQQFEKGAFRTLGTKRCAAKI